jgi:hypothetical protein
VEIYDATPRLDDAGLLAKLTKRERGDVAQHHDTLEVLAAAVVLGQSLIAVVARQEPLGAASALASVDRATGPVALLRTTWS